MAMEKDPSKTGHHEVRGSRKEGWGMGNPIAQGTASPKTDKMRCLGGWRGSAKLNLTLHLWHLQSKTSSFLTVHSDHHSSSLWDWLQEGNLDQCCPTSVSHIGYFKYPINPILKSLNKQVKLILTHFNPTYQNY